MKKVIWSIVLSWVCLVFAAGIGTRDAVSACDGKVYKKGDKIMFGVPKVSGYLFISSFDTRTHSVRYLSASFRP